MSVFRSRWILDLGRRARLYVRLEAGLTGTGTAIDLPDARAKTSVARRAEPDGFEPENIVWILGTGRTGSTWLGRMMGDLADHSLWHEPYIGEIFGTAYYVRAWERQREREGYILSRAHKQLWLRSMRDLILEGARARYPATSGYLVIKEPHGSIAAPLLMEALPESRMVFLIRDPRDVVASRLDAHRKGSWTRKLTGKREESLADRDPDAFVRAAARLYLRDVEKVKEAYDAFDGRKSLVKYERLRANTLEELKNVYSALGISATEKELRRVAQSHDWDNIPDHRKGPGKAHRKARPGSWSEDLTRVQVASVEEITASVLDEFYAG
jgi:LPS sulfotransferase NodH